MDDESTAGNPTRTEGERLLGISEKLLQSRDLTGSREFALLAQETEPLLEGSDQILAITDVLLASERRVNNNRLHYDWYSILQSDRRSDPDSLKKNYRRLALLLHPDKNKFAFADSAFKLVADAWAVLSDPSKRVSFDREFDHNNSSSFFSKVDLRHAPPQSEKDKLPVRRSSRGGGGEPMEETATFWTACPYCYVLYEYPKGYEECCLRCQNCERAFHATSISSLPPRVPGKEAYYCCWGFFPLGFSLLKSKDIDNHDDHVARTNNNVDASNNNNNNNNNNTNAGFPNWMPGMFATPAETPVTATARPNINAAVAGVDVSDGSASAGVANNNVGNVNVGRARGYTDTPQGMPAPGPKKRGRPRKNPVPG